MQQLYLLPQVGDEGNRLSLGGSVTQHLDGLEGHNRIYSGATFTCSLVQPASTSKHRHYTPGLLCPGTCMCVNICVRIAGVGIL